MTTHLFSMSTERSGSSKVVYLWLSPEAQLPDLPFEDPFRVIVVNELPRSARQSAICDWLAASGCRYMMAWGSDASSWDDSMDWTALERTGYVVDAASSDFIMTTWHDHEPLSEVFEFALDHAKHPSLELDDLLVLHLANQPNPGQVLGNARR